MKSTGPASRFDALLDDIEQEAKSEGPAAVMELRALDLKFEWIGQLLRRRRELRLTQKQLAELTGVGQAEISKIESGRKSPTLDTYSRLAAALDIHPFDRTAA